MIFLIVFLPLLGSLITGFFGRKIGDRSSMIITCTLLILSMCLGWTEYFVIKNNHKDLIFSISRWIESGDFEVSWALRYDMLTSVMVIVITTVSAMVHIYSVIYFCNAITCYL